MNNTELYQNFESVVSQVKNGKAKYATLDIQSEDTHKSFIINYDDKGNFIELYSDIENPNVTSVLTSFYGGDLATEAFYTNGTLSWQLTDEDNNYKICTLQVSWDTLVETVANMGMESFGVFEKYGNKTEY